MTTIWTTYHKPEQLKEYHLKDSPTRALYYANGVGHGLPKLNALNPAWSEIITLWYVWHNRIKSDLVGFNHYRRQFEPIEDLQPGECQIYSIEDLGDMTIRDHYALCHNLKDFDALISLMMTDDVHAPYARRLINDHQFINRCCFMMAWTDFVRMCDWLFPLMDEWQRKVIGFGLDADADDILKAYREHVTIHSGMVDKNPDYQMRIPSFLAERLVGVWIAENLKARVNPQQ